MHASLRTKTLSLGFPGSLKKEDVPLKYEHSASLCLSVLSSSPSSHLQAGLKIEKQTGTVEIEEVGKGAVREEFKGGKTAGAGLPVHLKLNWNYGICVDV